MKMVRIHEPRIKPTDDAKYLHNIEIRHRRPKWDFAVAVERVTGGQVPDNNGLTAADVMNAGPKPPLRHDKEEAA